MVANVASLWEGDILVVLACSKRAAVQCKIKRWRRGRWLEARGVVTAGHSHTSPLSVEIRSELVRFYLSKNGQKVSGEGRREPTAGLPGSILSPQEAVTLFWKQRPIIFGPTG